MGLIMHRIIGRYVSALCGFCCNLHYIGCRGEDQIWVVKEVVSGNLDLGEAAYVGRLS